MSKINFINPFDFGVNYEQFLAAIPEDSNVSKYCKNNLTQAQIDFLIEDLTHFKKNKNTKKCQ